MAKIRRANVTLDVDDTQVEYYLNLGYNLIDDKGNILKRSMSNDVNTLQHELTEALKKISQLEKQIAELTDEAQKSKSSKKKVAE